MIKYTRVRTVTDLRTHRPALEEAAAALRGGRLVVFATETVYGIGANALDGNAVSGIFTAKGRPQDNPLIVHIHRMEELPPLVREVPLDARRLAERFWPGPLTIILPSSTMVPEEVRAGLDTVAVRMPSHPVARGLLHLAGIPVAAPSANLSGRPSPTTAQHCIADLNGKVDMILDSGKCPLGLESTVVTLAGARPRLLRPGAVTPEELQEVLGELDVDDAVFHAVRDGQAAASPGMKYKHYAPQARMVLVHGGIERYLNYLRECRGEGVYGLVFDEDIERMELPCVSYGKEDHPSSQAERLFSALRKLDELGAKKVYVRAPKTGGVGLAVYNRIVRACAFTEVYLDA